MFIHYIIMLCIFWVQKKSLWSLEVAIFFICRCKCSDPLDTRRKWRIHQMFRRCSSFFVSSTHTLFPEGIISKKILCTIEKNIMYNQFRSGIQVQKLCKLYTSAWCSPANLLHIFRRPFLRNTSGWLLLGI